MSHSETMGEKIVVKPAQLQIGDMVAIVAPASNLKREYLARGMAELERLGFRIKHREDILDKARYTAGSDERRAEELMQAFADPDVKAVWAARGGYGMMRILKLLDEELLRANPKIFIGYSDLTALHLYLYRRFGWVTFHGPMASPPAPRSRAPSQQPSPRLVPAARHRAPRRFSPREPCPSFLRRERYWPHGHRP